MRITARRPCSAAASDSACAWLPDDAAATPCSGASAVTALYAPRNLKAPTRWRFSALRKTRPPQRSSSVRAVITGVRWATPRRRSAAARTSSIPMARSPMPQARSAGRPVRRGAGGRRAGARDERAQVVVGADPAAVRAGERAGDPRAADSPGRPRALRTAVNLRGRDGRDAPRRSPAEHSVHGAIFAPPPAHGYGGPVRPPAALVSAVVPLAILAGGCGGGAPRRRGGAGAPRAPGRVRGGG